MNSKFSLQALKIIKLKDILKLFKNMLEKMICDFIC